MRSRIALTALCMAIVTAVAVTAGEDEAWMDMENCAMCKPLAANPELMQHMKWSHYDLTNGIMSVTMVDREYAKPYATACMAMEATEKQIQAGEKVPLCNMCTSLISLMGRGMQSDLVETDFGHVRVCTSADPELVADMHAWAERTRTEMAKMAEMEPSTN